jgi:NifU-like protein involved in Fe-S cluster formation
VSALDLYEGRLLELASDIPYAERLAPEMERAGFGSAHRVSRLCGSEITVDVQLSADGCIAALGMDVQACLLGQASASVLARDGLGASRVEVQAGRDVLVGMLKHNVAPPSQGVRFWELRHLEGVRDYPQRHGSVLLAFDAALAAMDVAAASLPRTDEKAQAEVKAQ